MGEARRKTTLAEEFVKFDFAGPDLVVEAGDRVNLFAMWRREARLSRQIDATMEQAQVDGDQQAADAAAACLAALEQLVRMDAFDDTRVGALDQIAGLRGHLGLDGVEALPAAPSAISLVTKAFLRELVRAAYPQGDKGKKMKLADRMRWGVWQRGLTLLAPETLEVTVADLEWLRKLLESEDLELPEEQAQWSLALLTYVRDLHGETLRAVALRDAQGA